MLHLKHYYLVTTLAFSLAFPCLAQAKPTTQTLLQAVKHYQQDLQAGNLSAATTKAEKAYNLATQLLSVEDKSWQTIADDHSYLLMKSKQHKKATAVLEKLLSAKEKSYGKFAKELISPLKSLVAATKQQKKLNKQYSLRYQKLALRHYSDQYVAQYEEQPLNSTQQAKNLANKLRKVTGKNYQVTDGGKWDFIYNVDTERDFTPLLTQMELGYRSSLGFLFAFNILSKPAEDKFKAVFFETRADYKKYLHSFKSINRSQAAESSLGMYIDGSIKSLFLFEWQTKNKSHNSLMEKNVLRHEIAHQVFRNLGLHVKGVWYPRWLTEGFATSFEFSQQADISGPQTENLPAHRLKKIQTLRKKNKFMPLRQLIGLTPISERNRSSIKDVYYTGGMLVRYLYLHHPEKFKNYIADFSRRKTDSSGKRLSIFSRHFGKPEQLQSQFDAFVTNAIEVALAKGNRKPQTVAKR